AECAVAPLVSLLACLTGAACRGCDALSLHDALPISEKDVDNMIENLRKQQTTWQQVERAAQDGDQLTVSYVGTLDGEPFQGGSRSEEHTSELQSRENLVCRLLLETENEYGGRVQYPD